MLLLDNKIQKKPDKISFKQLSESYFKKPPPQKLFQSSQKQHHLTQVYTSSAQLSQNYNQNYNNYYNQNNNNFNNVIQMNQTSPRAYVSEFQQESQKNIEQLVKSPNVQLISSTWDVRHLDKFLENSVYSNKNQQQYQPSSNQNQVSFKNQNFQSLNDLEQQFKNAKLIDINSQQFDENQSTTHFKLPNATNTNTNASIFQQQFQQQNQQQQQLLQQSSQQLQKQGSQRNLISTQNSNLSQTQRMQKSISMETNKRMQIQKILDIKKKKQKGERLVGSSSQQCRSMSKKNDSSLNNLEGEKKQFIDFPNNYTKLNMLVTLHQQEIPKADTYYNTNFNIEKPKDLQSSQCYQYDPFEVSRLQTPSFARKELQDVKQNQIKLKQWRQNFFEANKKYRVHKAAFKSGIMGVDNPLNSHTQLYKQEHEQIVEREKGKDFINQKFRQDIKKHTKHFILTDGSLNNFIPFDTNNNNNLQSTNNQQNEQSLTFEQQQNQNIKTQFGNFWTVKNRVKQPFMQKFEKTGFRLFGAKPDKFNFTRAQNLINNEIMKKPHGYNILSNEEFNLQLKQDRGLLDQKEHQFFSQEN